MNEYVDEIIKEFSSWPHCQTQNGHDAYWERGSKPDLSKGIEVLSSYKFSLWIISTTQAVVLLTDGGSDHTNGEYHLITSKENVNPPGWYLIRDLIKVIVKYSRHNFELVGLIVDYKKWVDDNPDWWKKFQ